MSDEPWKFFAYPGKCTEKCSMRSDGYLANSGSVTGLVPSAITWTNVDRDPWKILSLRQETMVKDNLWILFYLFIYFC